MLVPDHPAHETTDWPLLPSRLSRFYSLPSKYLLESQVFSRLAPCRDACNQCSWHNGHFLGMNTMHSLVPSWLLRGPSLIKVRHKQKPTSAIHRSEALLGEQDSLKATGDCLANCGLSTTFQLHNKVQSGPQSLGKHPLNSMICSRSRKRRRAMPGAREAVRATVRGKPRKPT